MRYLIYDGGNLLSLPWELTQSAQIGDYYVIPTEHQKRRSIELEKHIDTASRNWTGHYDGLFNESDKPLIIENNDEVGTHLVGRGWLLKHVVLHVKSQGVGSVKPFYETKSGVRTVVTGPDGQPLVVDLSKPGHYIGFIPAGVPDDDGDPETPNAPVVVPITIPASSVQVVVPAQTVTIEDGAGATVGTGTVAEQTITAPVPEQTVNVNITDSIAVAAAAGISAPLPLLTQENGFLGFVYEGTNLAGEGEDPVMSTLEGCFGTYLALEDYVDEHRCECAPKPCDSDFPPALCDGDYLPSQVSSGSNGTGGGNGQA
ncbi:hypothetical protein ACM75Z_30230 [Pseudomonas aeruginosa]